MRFGLGVPPDREFADPNRLVSLAIEAEAAGWDGFFLWDHLTRRRPWQPLVDPWIVLAAVAQATEAMTLGPMVTPLARRRPAIVARATASLDVLSGGRTIFGVGLGAPDDEFWRFGDEPDARIRGQRVDESLEIIAGLWTGEPFSFRGEHFVVDDVQFEPTPVRSRVPVWVAGGWPNRAPMRRAARWDGVCPVSRERGAYLDPGEVGDIVAFVAGHRAADAGPFDVAIQIVTTPARAAETAEAYAAAGTTWLVETLDQPERGFEELRERVLAGPTG